MTQIDELSGRIVALELMMNGFVVAWAMEQGAESPMDFLDGWKARMTASFQHLDRPIDQRADDVWSSAMIALELLFSNAAKRIAASA